MSDVTTDNLALRDSDGDEFVTRTVVDSSGTHTPVYLLAVGSTGQQVASSTNPLPVGTVRDGTAVDYQDLDGTVGNTAGLPHMAVDAADKSRFIKASDLGGLITMEAEGFGEEIVKQLKAINFQLSLITGCEIGKDETDG